MNFYETMKRLNFITHLIAIAIACRQTVLDDLVSSIVCSRDGRGQAGGHGAVERDFDDGMCTDAARDATTYTQLHFTEHISNATRLLHTRIARLQGPESNGCDGR